jgi:hypothetical protein
MARLGYFSEILPGGLVTAVSGSKTKEVTVPEDLQQLYSDEALTGQIWLIQDSSSGTVSHDEFTSSVYQIWVGNRLGLQAQLTYDNGKKRAKFDWVQSEGIQLVHFAPMPLDECHRIVKMSTSELFEFALANVRLTGKQRKQINDWLVRNNK